MTAILTALSFSVIMILKWIVAKVMYPFAYLAKDWVYGWDIIKNYTMPKGVQDSWVKWCFWIFLDDDQPSGYPDWYAKELIGYIPMTKWDKFRCAYSWSAWRNPAYNINYYYFGNQSPIIDHKIWFGKYTWDRKLRASNDDNGAQWVWYTTAKGQKRFLFSIAKQSLPIINKPFTLYYGWNTNTNGRFTVAIKFK